jgi:hypothetical protein
MWSWVSSPAALSEGSSMNRTLEKRMVVGSSVQAVTWNLDLSDRSVRTRSKTEHGARMELAVPRQEALAGMPKISMVTL